MKSLILLTALLSTSFFYAQGIKASEERIVFNNGSHNSVIVTVPHGMKDVLEKELKSELKDWGGKYNSSKGELIETGAILKPMGDKPFDAYGMVMEGGKDYLKIAVAVDLGGAYLTSKDHSKQYDVIEGKLIKLAERAALASIDEELQTEGKVLKGLQKEKGYLEKAIESSKQDIENAKKKIAEAEQKIKDNEAAVSKKEEEIGTQASKIGDVENKKKSVK